MVITLTVVDKAQSPCRHSGAEHRAVASKNTFFSAHRLVNYIAWTDREPFVRM